MNKKVITIDLNKTDIYYKFRKEFGKYLFSIRSTKNMSLRQLRDKTGLKEERIDKLEVGRTKFDYSGAICLLKLYDVKAYVVLCRGEELDLK